MVPIREGNFFQSSHIAIDVHDLWRQEVSLQLVLQEHVVLRRKANACSLKRKKRRRRKQLGFIQRKNLRISYMYSICKCNYKLL